MVLHFLIDKEDRVSYCEISRRGSFTLKTYSITMSISVNLTLEADSKKHARLIALGSLASQCSEFDRRVDTVDDITDYLSPRKKAPRRGIGSY